MEISGEGWDPPSPRTTLLDGPGWAQGLCITPGLMHFDCCLPAQLALEFSTALGREGLGGRGASLKGQWCLSYSHLGDE